eukprot:846483-Amorphochlora_amoeboformis.AAC.1
MKSLETLPRALAYQLAYVVLSRSPGTRRRDSRSPRSHRPRSRRRHSPSRDRGGKQRHDTPSRPPAPPPTPLTERKRKKAKKKEKKEKKVKKNKKKKKKEELQTSRLSFDGGDSEEEGWKEKEGKVVKWIGDIQERCVYMCVRASVDVMSTCVCVQRVYIY